MQVSFNMPKHSYTNNAILPTSELAAVKTIKPRGKSSGNETTTSHWASFVTETVNRKYKWDRKPDHRIFLKSTTI